MRLPLHPSTLSKQNADHRLVQTFPKSASAEETNVGILEWRVQAKSLIELHHERFSMLGGSSANGQLALGRLVAWSHKWLLAVNWW
jgi:hypothetical protein